ncbi:MAG: hypothetical protein GPOALKHO_000921 [Sodalis sp.]|nr:MAG: hypothetical protein GPOALKHO_000921 [Sodalis sp.]
MGIDEFVASTRINRYYEEGAHEVNIQIAQYLAYLATALGVPLSYLYTEDDKLVEFMLIFLALPKPGRGGSGERCMQPAVSVIQGMYLARTLLHPWRLAADL